MAFATAPHSVRRPSDQGGTTSVPLAGRERNQPDLMPKKISEIRRPEIVQAMYDAIAKHGMSPPSYDLIAREGDMSRQLVRHYYKDPEQMAVDLCDHLAATYRDCLMRGIIQADESRRLQVFLDFYFDVLANKGLPKPKDDQVYDGVMALANSSQRVRDNLRGQYSLLQATLAHEVQISHPDLPQKACHELGYLVVALMYGHWKMVASLGIDDAMNRVSREAVDRLIASYVERYEAQD